MYTIITNEKVINFNQEKKAISSILYLTKNDKTKNNIFINYNSLFSV